MKMEERKLIDNFSEPKKKAYRSEKSIKCYAH